MSRLAETFSLSEIRNFCSLLYVSSIWDLLVVETPETNPLVFAMFFWTP